ncbi:hypothetical protein GNP59_02920 [Aliivibrio fischeri]|nr:hypothetical protein [Aliivibrio fischeri]MUL14952.1 hypothetical protein [Aliivibrio fischeri]
MPLNVPEFPSDTLRLLQIMKEFESLTVKAAVNGDINAALRGLILNPIVPTGDVLEKALDETIRENADYLPQFSNYLNQ